MIVQMSYMCQPNSNGGRKGAGGITAVRALGSPRPALQLSFWLNYAAFVPIWLAKGDEYNNGIGWSRSLASWLLVLVLHNPAVLELPRRNPNLSIKGTDSCVWTMAVDGCLDEVEFFTYRIPRGQEEHYRPLVWG